MEGALDIVITKNAMWHLGEGDFIMFDKISLSTIELPKRRFQTFPDKSLPEKIYMKVAPQYNVKFVRLDCELSIWKWTKVHSLRVS